MTTWIVGDVMVFRLRWPRNAQCLAKCGKVRHTHSFVIWSRNCHRNITM
jgi:hypothetical protein